MNIYSQTVPQLSKMLGNLDGWLDKAEAFASDNELTQGQLLENRLYPNMYPLRGQIEHAIHNVTLLAARLADVPQPEPTKTDGSWSDLRHRVTEAREFLSSLDEDRFGGAEERWAEIPLIDGMHIRGEDLFKDFSMPNVYFHLTTAYGLLRGLGVPLGKADFIGPMALAPKA